jgi:hypothetical protein
MANKRRRKKQIVSLEGPNGDVNDTEGMTDIAINYYKQLFSSENMMDINLSSDFWNPIELVSDARNSESDKEFSEEEVKAAVFGSYAEGAPSPDGFSFLFYQNFWDLIKFDLLNMFKD